MEETRNLQWKLALGFPKGTGRIGWPNKQRISYRVKKVSLNLRNVILLLGHNYYLNHVMYYVISITIYIFWQCKITTVIWLCVSNILCSVFMFFYLAYAVCLWGCSGTMWTSFYDYISATFVVVYFSSPFFRLSILTASVYDTMPS